MTVLLFQTGAFAVVYLSYPFLILILILKISTSFYNSGLDFLFAGSLPDFMIPSFTAFPASIEDKLPLKESILNVEKNRVEVTTTRVEGGFALDGQWDLRPYSKLRFTAHNDNPDDYLSLYVFLENGEVDTDSRPTRGIMEDWFKV